MISNKLLISVQLVTLLTALCCSTLVSAKITVDLEVDTSGADPVLKVAAGGNSSQCPSGPLDCIEVGVGKKPYIIFKLENACGAGDDDPDYRLTGFRITQVNKIWPTPAYPMNPIVAGDFNADPNTGEIDFSKDKNKLNDRKIKFKNLNSHAYTVFYEITAQHCEDNGDDDLHLDPSIRNRG